MNRKRKILLLSTGDINGAYEAIYRIANFMKEDGHEVAMAVQKKTKTDSFIYEIANQKSLIKRLYDKIIVKIFSQIRTQTDAKYVFLDEDENKRYVDVKDILNSIPFVPEFVISGMTDGFLVTNHLATIKSITGARVYTVTVDMSPFTGGCHFAWDCRGYEKDCKECPAIINKKYKDWPHKNFLIKKKNIENAEIQIIAGSGWTLKQAKQSSLFKDQKNIENINSCIDQKLFNANNKDIAKRIFNIDEKFKLIFCGSQNLIDPRKGFIYFKEALGILYKMLDESVRDKVCILIVGRDYQNVFQNEILFKTHAIDYIKDYRLLSLAYQASDIFVCSSIEDSGPMMVSEALACGTPVVGFEMGVVSNMVIEDYNGYKAVLKDSADLANGLFKILSLSQEEFLMYSGNAVKQVEMFSSQDSLIKTLNQILND
jgi:glycosyltransferase involved in cell wall biosynthesis